MELIWPDAAPWRALQEAIAPILHPPPPPTGAVDLPVAVGVLRVQAGDPGGPLAVLGDDGLALHPDLLGPDMHARADADWRAAVPDPALAALALDRWRRAVGVIREAQILLGLAQQQGASPAAVARAWWLAALAAEQVDAQDPGLGWLWPDTIDLLLHPDQDPRTAPRRLAWLVRWLRAQGEPLPTDLSRPPALSAARWAAFGLWCRDAAHGPSAQAPLPLPLAPPRDTLPEAALPLSLHPLRLRAGPAGLRLGDHAAPPFLAGDTEAVVVLACGEDGILPAAPTASRFVGRWTLLSGAYGQRTGGARGVELVLLESGQVEITLANAFVGPLSGDALSLASQFGASGFGSGRWRVSRLETDTEGEVVLRQLNVDHLTIHPRKGLKFALPGQGWQERLRAALARLHDRPLTATLLGDDLTLSCRLRDDTDLILRLQRTPEA